MSGGFLTGGRRTRFTPTGEASRAPRVRAATGEGATTAPDPVQARVNGEAAAELLGSILFANAIGALEAEAMAKFDNSAPGAAGSADRDAAHATIHALKGIVTRLEAMVDDAKISAAREADEDTDDA